MTPLGLLEGRRRRPLLEGESVRGKRRRHWRTTGEERWGPQWPKWPKWEKEEDLTKKQTKAQTRPWAPPPRS